MGRPPVTSYVVERIKVLWAEDPTQTATKVYERARVTLSNCPSKRKVQDIIKSGKKEASAHGVATIDPEQIPWGAGWPDDPEEIACSFRLRGTALLLGITSIDTLTAQWSLRLRKVFCGEWEGSVVHLLFSRLYAERQRATERIYGVYAEPDYEDLDGALMFHYWTSKEDLDLYKAVLDHGGVPKPPGMYVKARYPDEYQEEVFHGSPQQTKSFYYCSDTKERQLYRLECFTLMLFRPSHFRFMRP